MKILTISLGVALLTPKFMLAAAQEQPDQPKTLVKPLRNVTQKATCEPRFDNPSLQIEMEMTEFVRGISDLDFHENAFENEVAPHISGARLDALGLQEWKNFFRRGGKEFMFRNVQVMNFGENWARVKIAYRIHDGEYQTGIERTETLNLKHEIVPWNGETRWRVVPQASGAARWRFYTLAGVAFFGSKRDGTLPLLRSQISLQNLQHLATATQRLRQAYAGRYRLKNRVWRQVLRGYFDPNQSGTPFVSFDEVASIPGASNFYNFNDNLSNRKFASIKRPARTVLFSEGRTRKPLFRYNGKAAICFVDGHVALVSPNEAKKLIWKP